MFSHTIENISWLVVELCESKEEEEVRAMFSERMKRINVTETRSDPCSPSPSLTRHRTRAALVVSTHVGSRRA